MRDRPLLRPEHAARNTTVAILLAAAVLYPRTSSAMEIQMFDDMAMQDQHEYLTFLVKDAEKVLIELNQHDEAAKLRELFTKIPLGARRSVGEAAYEHYLIDTCADIAAKTYEPLHFNMESVLILTLAKNGITLPDKFFKNLTQLAREKPFWPKLPLRTK